ncbi:MAG TPA: GspH/FimT family pseudopilin [Gemmatimonadaceae bacterium]|nr:GspH/FimT family pseudopilin [Gemmatimonadaceae bacterium]
MNNARGFTLIELIVVVMVIGVMIGIVAPKVKDTMEKINVREAKVSLANYVARTRGSAVARGCQSTLNLTTGTAGKVWVTSCKSGDAGRTVAIDTVGNVEQLATRYGVNLTSTVNTITFDRRGIATNFAFQTIRVAGIKYSTVKDSIRINPIGKVLLK